ncbi:MAG: hypothetical protein DCF15_21045 [Phormidesmis priestleyi]|uniref:Uncharacterized protein n=1 Tax=Phormidesmis priestleyi TaxID=268141 RepID=A0A2W4YSU6_9CYAN|nr:MAG: hypothetical protein DCF15_21045 [Phormidesmis priestleyi]
MKRSLSAPSYSPLHRWHQRQSARLAYYRGVACARKSSHSLAIAAFTQAIDKGCGSEDKALVMRGISRMQMKDVGGAIADFTAVIAAAVEKSGSNTNHDSGHNSGAEPNFILAQAHHYRGLLRQQAGNEAGALADWSAAITHWPHYPQPHYHRALVHLSQGQHTPALADLNIALESDPTMVAAYLQRGNLRHQLGDIPGAVADWEIAVCNDFTLEDAKQKLANVQQANYDAQFSAILAAPLAQKGLTVEVTHSGTQLDIHTHRQLGTGVNYYTLPDLIRQHLVPLHLANVSRFKLIGHLAEINSLEWSQLYDLYKGQPCPPSNWQAAFSTLVVFPPFGIPALIQAAKVKGLYERGQYIEALSASKGVKGLCVAGSVTLGVFALLPLGYAAYDSMQATPTLSMVKPVKNIPYRPYEQIFREESEL